MRAAVSIVVVALIGCGDDRSAAPTRPAPPPPSIAIDATQEPVMTPATVVPLEYEGVTLLTSLDELIALAAAKGWRQNAHAGSTEQFVTVFTTPDHPVKRYKLGYEAGRLVNIEIDYRAPDPARLALRDRFVHTRHVDGAWYLTDDDHAVLASVDDAGQIVRALHLASLRDRREADALLHSAFAAIPRSDER